MYSTRIKLFSFINYYNYYTVCTNIPCEDENSHLFRFWLEYWMEAACMNSKRFTEKELLPVSLKYMGTSAIYLICIMLFYKCCFEVLIFLLQKLVKFLWSLSIHLLYMVITEMYP